MKQFILNYVSLFMLVFLTVDALDASWWQGPLLAKIQLNLFYNNHALSILAVTGSGFYLWLRKKDPLPTAAFAAFGIASIHELILDVSDVAFFGQQSGISIGYAVALFGVLGVGFFVSKRYHKEVWFAAAGIMFVWFFLTGYINLNHPFGWYIGGTIDPSVPFGASPDFNNPVANGAEVGSWLLPCSLWLLPRRWFKRE